MRVIAWAWLAAITATVTVADARAEVRIGLSAPLTGTYSWVGLAAEQGVNLALEDLNSQRRVLGERVGLLIVDDYCDGDQAVAAANSLVEARVVAAFGPLCSAAAIPASQVFAEAELLMITPTATSPQLTEQGLENVFRLIGRDDLQGRIAGDLLARRWGDKKIAILHDGEIYGAGLAYETKKRLNELGVIEKIFDVITPKRTNYPHIVQRLKTLGIQVLYYAGYAVEAALLLRQAKEGGIELQLVGGDALAVEDFPLIAGPAAEGTLFTGVPDPRGRADAAAVAERVGRPDGNRSTLIAYAAVQAWAQAVEEVGSFDTSAVAAALRAHEFETILGTIGFDAKGDVRGYETFVWYVWGQDVFRPAEQEITEGAD